MKAATQQPPPSWQERESERLRKVAVQRKQERWLNPSAASLEREHEYLAWLETQPQQRRVRYAQRPASSDADGRLMF